MARAIIRFSIDDEKGNKTGDAVSQVLENQNFNKRGTRLWEVKTPVTDDALGAILDAIKVLIARPGGGELDHLWIYVDNSA